MKGSGCNLVTGACLPGLNDASNTVFHVKQESIEGADGSAEFPFDLVSDALDAGGSEITIFLHENEYEEPDFTKAVMIDKGRTVALIAGDGEAPTWTWPFPLSAVIAPLTINAGATVFVQGLHLSGTRVGGPESALYLDDTYVVGHENEELIASDGAYLYIRNSIIGDPLGGTGVLVVDSSVWITYTTIVSPSVALLCDDVDTGSIRNSLLLSSSEELSCPNLQILHSVVSSAEKDNRNWFRDWDASDFRLGNAALPDALKATVWQKDATLPDPMVDIEGDPRPIEKGEDYVGADVR